MKIFVLSGPGRDDLSARTFESLRRQNPGVPFWIYRSSGTDPIGDFWEMLREARGHDVLALEDDIVTARNFFRYAERWQSRHLTSFFHTRRNVLGAPVSPADFSFAQALKVPAPLLERLLEAPARTPSGAQDDDLGRALEALGELVIYHPSLVQHMGATSLIWPRTTTLEHRQARDFPGIDFDCLEGARA